jgi:chromosome segregation ATPase
MKLSSDHYDLLHREENVDRVNKYMKDDLSYEKDRNSKLKAAMQELNQQIIGMKEDVRRLEEEKRQMIRGNQEIQQMMQRQAGAIEDLEKEQYFNQERIRDANINIEQCGVMNGHMGNNNHNIKTAIDMVISERN